MIDKWFNEYKFSMEIILNACSRDKNPTPSINYVNGILKPWYDKGVQKLEDIELLDKKPEKKTVQRLTNQSSKATITKFHNFQQRIDKYSAQELEDIAQKKRDAYKKRSKGEA